jgi:hypothetical protein
MTKAISSLDNSGKNARDLTPWWRQSYCWLVISGPLVVVIAAFVTMYIAYHWADTLAPAYVEDHRLASMDARVAASLQPAEDVSKGAVLHAATLNKH